MLYNILPNATADSQEKKQLHVWFIKFAEYIIIFH